MRPRPISTLNAPLVIAQLVATLMAGVILFLAAVVLWVAGYQLFYAGRIFPGVSVAGVDLSGLGPQDAALKLSQTLSYPITGKVLFRDGDKVWMASPAELGMVFDASASARAAYRLGRGGGLFSALEGQIRARSFGSNVAPVIIFDQRVAYQYLQALSQQVDQPVVEASLQLQGTDVVAQPGSAGRRLNLDATLIYLAGQLQTFRDGEVPLVVQDLQPAILDVSAQANTARRVLSESLTLYLPNAMEGDPGPWEYDVPTLAGMLGVTRVRNGDQTEVQVTLNPDELTKILTGLAGQINRQPENAQFSFDEVAHQLVILSPSLTGRTLDVAASLNAINQGLLRGEHRINLVVQETQPALPDTVTAQDLGITELVSQQTTYFWGSSEARIQNIQTASARFNGVLVAPGEIFSMGQALGDVSLDNGFTEALIIYGGRTIKGVGGGVCQVSTTLFRTVFFGGYPVNERYSHAYRVPYYEETSSGSVDPQWAGLDATVYFPLVDFKFTNDTRYWILMETSVNLGNRSLTWKFFSTSDGRSVQWQTTGPQNVVPAPDPRFEKNEELKAGAMKQVDYAANGADVEVTRTVLKNGAIYFQDSFKTHYEAWQAVCQFAPGMNNPEKEAKRRNLCQAPKF